MTDYQEIQERGHVSTVEYLKRALDWMNENSPGYWHSQVRSLVEVLAVDTVSGNDYVKVRTAVREHGSIEAAIDAIESKGVGDER